VTQIFWQVNNLFPFYFWTFFSPGCSFRWRRERRGIVSFGILSFFLFLFTRERHNKKTILPPPSLSLFFTLVCVFLVSACIQKLLSNICFILTLTKTPKKSLCCTHNNNKWLSELTLFTHAGVRIPFLFSALLLHWNHLKKNVSLCVCIIKKKTKNQKYKI